MSELHIEGMGLIGSMLARRLHEEGIAFTWSDNDTPYTAWHVSTGLAYPDGDPDNQLGLERWRTILMGDLADEAAEVPYVFAHKSPPHSGRYPVTDYGALRMAEPTAIALNVPAFVENTRTAFEAERTGRTPGDRPVVVCHTTEARGDGYLWGWVARVRFDLPEAILLDCLGDQPALYAKKHRFNLTYAYPIPGTGQWWAGSVLQMQRTPKRADNHRLALLYGEWMNDAHELLGLRNIELDDLDQGWRPRAKKTDSGRVELRSDGRWIMPPMPTDGMRRGWLVVDDFIDQYQRVGSLL